MAEGPTRKKRDVENREERRERVRRNAEAQDDARAANDEALDAMVSKNLEEHGP